MIIRLGVTYSRCNKSFRQQSFPVRCIDDWNRLPDCVVESDTVLSFKTQLDKFLSRRRFDLDQIYKPDGKLKTLSNQTKEEVDKPIRAYTTPTKRYEGMVLLMAPDPFLKRLFCICVFCS